jgi:hypothetical protein
MTHRKLPDWVDGSITYRDQAVEVLHGLDGYWYSRIRLDGVLIQTTEGRVDQWLAEDWLVSKLARFTEQGH